MFCRTCRACTGTQVRVYKLCRASKCEISRRQHRSVRGRHARGSRGERHDRPDAHVSHRQSIQKATRRRSTVLRSERHVHRGAVGRATQAQHIAPHMRYGRGIRRGATRRLPLYLRSERHTVQSNTRHRPQCMARVITGVHSPPNLFPCPLTDTSDSHMSLFAFIAFARRSTFIFRQKCSLPDGDGLRL